MQLTTIFTCLDSIFGVKEEIEYWEKRMNSEEKKLRDLINKKLEDRGFHLRIMAVEIHEGGNIVAHFVPPVHKWRKEIPEASLLVQNELDKYETS
jgi:hypothetical protein